MTNVLLPKTACCMPPRGPGPGVVHASRRHAPVAIALPSSRSSSSIHRSSRGAVGFVENSSRECQQEEWSNRKIEEIRTLKPEMGTPNPPNMMQKVEPGKKAGLHRGGGVSVPFMITRRQSVVFQSVRTSILVSRSQTSLKTWVVSVPPRRKGPCKCGLKYCVGLRHDLPALRAELP
jgi:hypothetical protein